MQTEEIKCDVLIAGCGVSGLYAALNLPSTANIIMVTKTVVEECDSMLAQGGICVLHDEGDYDAFYDDTMRAGHYENRAESVDIMIRSSRSVIEDLIRRGVDFEREADGSLAYTREGAHSRPRICYHGDITGEEITTTLLENVRRLPNVRVLEHIEVTDIIEAPQGNRCVGVVCADRRGGEGAERRLLIRAPYTMLATGGIGGAMSDPPTSQALREMHAALPRSMALRLSIWITFRFIPQVYMSSIRDVRSLSRNLVVAKVRSCLMLRAIVSLMNCSRAMWFLQPSMSK